MRRPADRHIRWAAQAVTFYAPARWGMGSSVELLAWAQSHPRIFWDRLLDEVATCGVDYLELCFAPGDWTSLLAAYGDPGTAAHALRSRGLALAGSYQGGGHRLESALSDASLAKAMAEEVRRHAAFVRELGAHTVMTGPPRRFPLTGGYAADVPDPVLGRLAEVLQTMAHAAAAEDVRFAVHTEAYSCVCRPQEVGAIMSRTDPSLVNLCVDAGHVTLDGGDPVEVLRANGNRVSNVHWKDCAGPRSELPPDGEVTHEMMMERFRRAGDGIVDWPALMHALADRGFDGFAAAEIDLVPHPVEDTRAVLAFFDRELAGVYA